MPLCDCQTTLLTTLHLHHLSQVPYESQPVCGSKQEKVSSLPEDTLILLPGSDWTHLCVCPDYPSVRVDHRCMTLILSRVLLFFPHAYLPTSRNVFQGHAVEFQVLCSLTQTLHIIRHFRLQLFADLACWTYQTYKKNSVCSIFRSLLIPQPLI